MKSDILIIVPHYSKVELLKKCIYHIYEQDVDYFDVLVVDNGSEDSSVDFIKETEKKYDNFHSILLSENLGFAIAVNKGIQYAIDNKYRWSILLNNDAFISTNFVKNLYNAICNNKNYFAVSSLMLSYNEKNIVDDFGDNYNLLGYAYQRYTGQDISVVKSNSAVFSACAGASIYDNKKIEKVGLFDEKFFAYLEDVDLSYRARLMGYKCITEKNAICYHMGSATTGSKYNELKVRLSARNNIFLIYKNMPTLQILINIVPLLLGILFKQIFFIRIGYGLDYFFGLIDGIRGLRDIERNDFKKINPLKFIEVEIDLFFNTFDYIFEYINRKVG